MAIFLHRLPYRKNAIHFLGMAIFPYGNFPRDPLRLHPPTPQNGLLDGYDEDDNHGLHHYDTDQDVQVSGNLEGKCKCKFSLKCQLI